MRFLRYIRRWGKKVIFLLNKVDILASGSEVDEVLRAKPSWGGLGHTLQTLRRQSSLFVFGNRR